jgi:two-component system LytT family response regulator
MSPSPCVSLHDTLTVTRAIVIDDDPLACELLRHHLARIKSVEVVGEAGTVRDAKDILACNDYDVVFLDVHLVGGTGFDLVPFVHPDAAIVFVTGRDDHAVRAFEVNAVDYIVKPANSARLAETLRRLGPKGREPAVRKYRQDDSIFLRGAAASGRFVPLRSIVAIVSAENYTEVSLLDGARWLIRTTMDTWERMLPAELFARVHRTALVNIDAIEHVERAPDECTILKLRGFRQAVPVSRRAWCDLRPRLNERALV